MLIQVTGTQWEEGLPLGLQWWEEPKVSPAPGRTTAGGSETENSQVYTVLLRSWWGGGQEGPVWKGPEEGKLVRKWEEMQASREQRWRGGKWAADGRMPGGHRGSRSGRASGSHLRWPGGRCRS